VAVSRADQIKALEHEWWRRLPRVLWRPREVFSELDGSEETAEALQEPMVAVTVLAGIAMFLATTTAGRLFDDPEFDWLLVAVEAFLVGVLVAFQTYWIGGAGLLLGLRSLGSLARYRTARHVIGLSLMPFVLALLALWPVRLAAFGGDVFRSSGSDEGVTGDILMGVDAAFALWVLVLVAVGVSTVERWSVARAIAASAFAAALYGLFIGVFVYLGN
jgi:hypothetical protein